MTKKKIGIYCVLLIKTLRGGNGELRAVKHQINVRLIVILLTNQWTENDLLSTTLF